MRKITLLLAILAFSFSTYAVGMSGTYKVGTTEGANYTSLSAAVTALNTDGVAGDVVLEITSDITEAANIGLGVNTNGFSITIRPDADFDRTITFSSTTDNTGPSGHFVIGNSSPTVTWTDILTIATSNVTIDGFAVGGTTKRLKFTNASASTANARLITVVGACQNTIIKNCIFENKSTSATSPVCIVAIARQTSGIDVSPTNLTIENNTMSATSSVVGMGMRITNSGTPTSRVTGFIFKNNIVTAKRRLLEINYTTGGEIFGNQFTTLQTGAPGTVSYGVWTSTGVTGTINIYNNKFLKSTTEETGAFGHRVISLASAATYNVYNNTFAGMDKTMTSTAALNLTYLFYSGVAGKIYNNTFYMPALTNATHTGGYYRAINLSGNTAEIKNNIFVSDEATHTNTSFISAVPTPATNYNNFYQRATNANAKIVGTYATLSDYKTANPTKDINSKNVDVTFANIATGDLSLTGASIGDWQLAAPKLTSVTSDIKGAPRANLTYVGADEAATDLTTLAKQFTTTVPNGTSKVYVAGTFTGKSWDNTTPFELMPTGTANQFSGIFPCVDGVEYKYLCEKDDWDYEEGRYNPTEGGDPLKLASNRAYNASDNVILWYRVNKVTLNVSFDVATPVPTQLFVKGSFNGWASGVELTKSGNTFSTVLGGTVGDKYPANTQYKYYTNDGATDNWENNANNTPKGNRWSIAPVMNDVVERFTTMLTTDVNNVEINARIARTYSGIEVIVDGESTIELYNMNGALIDKARTTSTYTRDLNNGIYIIRINGKATKFVK